MKQTPSSEYKKGMAYALNQNVTASFLSALVFPPAVAYATSRGSNSPDRGSLALTTFGLALVGLLAYDLTESAPVPSKYASSEFYRGYKAKLRQRRFLNGLIGGVTGLIIINAVLSKYWKTHKPLFFLILRP